MTDEDDCSTFLLELDFAELLLDEFSNDGFAGLLSSPQAAKKSAAQTDAIKVNLFIAQNIVMKTILPYASKSIRS
jgi:hypothetical protein